MPKLTLVSASFLVFFFLGGGGLCFLRTANRVLGRRYVQPQWIFDCVNAHRLLDAALYAPGRALPPHLSPFVSEGDGDYVPPEKRDLMQTNDDEEAADEEIEDDSADEDIDEDEEEDGEELDDDEEPTPSRKAAKGKSAKPSRASVKVSASYV